MSPNASDSPNSSDAPASGETGRGILGAAGVIGSATLLSRILGLVREQVFATLFGASNMMDAFNLAFRIPNLLRNLFAEGAMSAALVPTFTRVRRERGIRAGWRLAGLVFRGLGLGVGFLALLGILFAPEIVGLYGSAFKAIPGKFELAVRMTRILFPFFPLVVLAAAFMAILNASGYFFVPAVAPALFNLVSVGAGFALYRMIIGGAFGGRLLPIEGMALGVLLGAIVQTFCQWPFVRLAGYHWPKPRRGDLSWREDPDLRRMLWLMVPGTLALGATQISLFINTVLATRLGPGAVSYLSYAFRLMQFPIGILGASLAQATLPAVSRQWVEGDVLGVRTTLDQNLKRVFAVNLPASAGLAFLGYPITELLFQYGRFYAEDVRSTAWALAMYSIGLTAYSVVKLLVPPCYALGMPRIAVSASVASVAVTVVTNLLTYRTLGFGGLALGTSLGAIANAGVLLYAVRDKLRDWPLGSIGISFAKNLCVALIMGLVCFWTHRGLSWMLPDWELVARMGKSGWVVARAFKLGLTLAEAGAIVYFAGLWIGSPELVEAVDIFAKKIKNMLSRSKT